MPLRLTIENVEPFGPNVWGAHLTGAEVRRLGQPRTSEGRRSIISVKDGRFVEEERLLSFSPEHANVLNVGSTDDALIIDIGSDASGDIGPAASSTAAQSEPLGSGDAAFLAECRRLLSPSLVEMATRLLHEIRNRYPGRLVEGLARKWVNQPENFLAITIQNRDQSLAIHVKGSPTNFGGNTLDIRPDRGSYCRFKLQHERQLEDAINVILASASRN